MKKIIVVLLFMLSFQLISSCCDKKDSCSVQKQENVAQETENTMGIILYSNDVETMWNAIRLANYSMDKGDKVSIFLLGKGVELDNLVKENKDLAEQTDAFLNNGGTILGCGTCLESRKVEKTQVCKFSSLSDLYDIIKQNKTILTF